MPKEQTRRRCDNNIHEQDDDENKKKSERSSDTRTLFRNGGMCGGGEGDTGFFLVLFVWYFLRKIAVYALLHIIHSTFKRQHCLCCEKR